MTDQKEQHHFLGKDTYGIDDARFVFVPNAVQCDDEDFRELEETLLKNPKKEVTVCGKTHHPVTGKRFTRPRHEAVFNKDYRYSGVTLIQEEKSNPLVDECLRHANGGSMKGPYTWALVNYYADGQDNVGMHQDNEEEVGDQPVRTYSFGATRAFVMKQKLKKKRKRDEQETEQEKKAARFVFELTHGSCGIMDGFAAQIKWEHGIPKRKKVSGPRISITPRC